MVEGAVDDELASVDGGPDSPDAMVEVGSPGMVATVELVGVDVGVPGATELSSVVAGGLVVVTTESGATAAAARGGSET